MSEKRSIFLLILILTAIVLIATAITSVSLHESEFENQRKRLVVTAKSQARLIEAIARFNRKFNQGYPGGTFQATLSQVSQAHDNFRGFGETGEFTLAKREKDRIVFLFRQHLHDLQIPEPIPFESGLAEPMRQALMGHSGSLIGLDYRGENVLAAYEPVAELDLGIVAKIDLAEIHAPFVKTGIITGLLAFIVILAGAFLIVRITNPIITQLQISQRAEKETHTQLIDAIENLPAAFMLFDGEERLVLLNSAMGKIFPEHEAAGMLKPGTHFEDIIRFSSRGLFADAWGREEEWVRERLAQFKNQSSIDVELQWADGRMFQALDHKTPDGWTVSIRLDITERKKAEEALRESEAKYRDLVETSQNLIWRDDREGHFTYLNPAWESTLGYNLEEMIGHEFPDFKRPEEREQNFQRHYRTMQGDSAINYESTYISNTGEEVILIFNAKPLFDASGQVVGAQGTATDITERKKAEEALRESEEQLRTILANAPVVLWALDSDGLFTLSEGNGLKALGLKPGEVVGQSVFHFYKNYPYIIADSRRALAGKSFFTTWEMDGLAYEARYSPLRDSAGEIIGTIGLAVDITERKQAEQALRENEAKYRGLAEGSLEGIVVHRHGEILFANQAFADIFGYVSVDEVLVLDSLDETIAPEDLERLCERRAARMRGEDVLNAYDYTSLQKNGSRIEVSCLNSLIDWEGSPAILVTYFDITERKRAEKALQESESRFRNLVEQAPDAFIVHDLQGHIVDVNQRVCDSLGYTREEFLSLHISDIENQFNPKIALKSWQEVVSGKTISHDGELRRKDGTAFSVELLLGSLSSGKEDLVLAIARDVTERRRAEEAFRESEANFRNLIEDSIEGVAIVSRESRFVFANQALAEMFGCESPGEMLHKSTMDFTAPLERDRLTDMFQARLRGEEAPSQYQYQGQRRDASLIWLDRHIMLVNWMGEPAFLSRFVEITEQKRNEEKIRVQEHLLIHADKMATLGIFVSGVAHEINNPNTSIMMNVPLLEKMWRDLLPMLQMHRKRDPDFTLANIPFDEAQEVFPSLLSDISGSSQRIKRFVENLKNYAQKREIREMREIDVNEVVESAVTLMRNQIERMTHAFSAEYDRSIPSFKGDFMDIEQVVINLITNACQALSNKEKGVRITTRFAKDQERILVEVADEGEGIPEEILDKITDPFFSTKYEAGGTGLGLSVSLDILKKYGGNLEFSSTPGVGTTATLVMPATDKVKGGNRF